MKYRLRISERPLNCKIMCACGKCNPEVHIDESMKDEFKRMLGWNEEKFNRLTEPVQESEGERT